MEGSGEEEEEGERKGEGGRKRGRERENAKEREREENVLTGYQSDPTGIWIQAYLSIPGNCDSL